MILQNSMDTIKTFITKFKLNKFSIALIAFVVWISFFDKHNLINQYKLSSAITNLEKEVENFEKEYQIAVEEKIDLERNKEKYAREHHNFTGQNEELFIIKGNE